MVEQTAQIYPVTIEHELKQSYLDYAMSVIVGRALPDVRDGLKPVHRRVLFAMSQLGNDFNKPHKKSARIVGDVIGKYHPHGDAAVYDTIVRMAQSFSLRYLLIDGQGNFGSVDGDAPAAMRYTEIRMSRFAHELLADLDKETVTFSPNYDETEFAPNVLPSRIPNLLVNGSSGIAVGMATNIPPHNLREIIDACIGLIDRPEMTFDELVAYVPGPDFPTAGIINGRSGIIDAYRTGRGRISVRARTVIEGEDHAKQSIVVTELPYQVNKARLIEKIAELVQEKKIEGITGLRDESDKEGMRMVIELRKGEMPEIVLNNLYAHTQLQSVFGINMVALDNGQPRIFNLKEALLAFIVHRREVVTRRTVFDLRKARERAHLLEGLSVALANIDPVIALIKAAGSPEQARSALMATLWTTTGAVLEYLQRTEQFRPDDVSTGFGLTPDGYRLSLAQAQAILDLRLHRLTGLEQDKIVNEYHKLIESIVELKQILSDDQRLMAVIRSELLEIKEQFGDDRRTEIIANQQDLSNEDFIARQEVVLTLSHTGYVKSQTVDTYRAQRRGGRGKQATQVKDEDSIYRLIVANTHDAILCFSDQGRVYWLKAYQFPVGARHARGKPIVNLLSLQENERINAILPVSAYGANTFVFMTTQRGVVKKVSLEEFSRPRATGIIALQLEQGDCLIGVELTNGQQDVMLFTDTGKVVRFHENTVRAMGRTARGVRGITLTAESKVVSLVVVRDDGAILTATEKGYGKRTALEDYRTSGRGGQGVISIQVNERNGRVVGAEQVIDSDDVMLISNAGTLVRIPVESVSLVGRNTQGVRLITLQEDENLVEIEKIVDPQGQDSTALVEEEPSST